MGKKVIFISRSDLRGGAAIVTYRLMMAMRDLGVDARMLVCEKLSDSPYIDRVASRRRIQYSFLKERLEVFVKNGFNRSLLFKVDPASEGLPVWKHPWVKEADAIYLGWVNQGMLSLDGVRRLNVLGKPMIWVMHDMWNFTGICHHAGECDRYEGECGFCPFLGKKRAPGDMSHDVWRRKKDLYGGCGIRFVAVSSWLARKAAASSLLGNQEISVIPNPFKISSACDRIDLNVPGTPVGIVFGAARLDDPIKNLPVLKKALRIIAESHPDEAARMELVTFGNFKTAGSGEGFAIAHRHLGVLDGEKELRKAYGSCGIVVSSSDFESFGATLVEGQSFGCIPVAFDHGGQCDIIDHRSTGWLAPWNDDPEIRAASLAEGIIWAFRNAGNQEFIDRMRKSVVKKFSASEVARRMLALAYPHFL